MNDVRRQLVVYERNGRILKWHDRQIPPGADWRHHIDRRLGQAEIILLFVSPYFIDSRYCYEIEGQAALRRHSGGEARVVPVILRPCSWEETPFSMLQALPRDAKPVSRWEDRDEACLDVARGVMALVDQLVASQRVAPDDRSQPSRVRASDSPSSGQTETTTGPPRDIATLSDSKSLADLSSARCTSPACLAQDVELSDGVEISALTAERDGWRVHGVVEIGYTVDGRCRMCGRIFQVVKREIPVQFPELTCNECDRRAFLQYKVQDLKRVAGGFEFTVEIRCSGCRGRKQVSKLLTGLLRAIGIRVGLEGIKVSQG